MAQSKLLYLGIKGSVLGVDASSGVIRWVAQLKGSDFVNVTFDGVSVFAATHGEVFCLDPLTGESRWHNPLKGYGWGLVSMAGDGIAAPPFPVVAQEKRRRDQQAAASSSGASSAT